MGWSTSQSNFFYNGRFSTFAEQGIKIGHSVFIVLSRIKLKSHWKFLFKSLSLMIQLEAIKGNTSFRFSYAYADDLAHVCPTFSTGTVMIKFKYNISTRTVLKMLIHQIVSGVIVLSVFCTQSNENGIVFFFNLPVCLLQKGPWYCIVKISFTE